MAKPSSPRTSLPNDIARKFISACHILHYHSVLDAYGHLSIRHIAKPDLFVMPRQIAPALVCSPEDLVDYRVSDATPIDASMTDGYVERYIHSEIYKKYPTVHAVIHSHADSVIPYGISGVPLQACFHMAGFLGTSTPVFDISAFYQADDIRDLLIRNARLGEVLANHLAKSKGETENIDHAVVLMRGHGMTVIAPNMEECVLRAVYTQKNASIQSMVLVTQSAYQGIKNTIAPKYLDEEEATAASQMTHWSSGRPWKLWIKEVEHSSLYINKA